MKSFLFTLVIFLTIAAKKYTTHTEEQIPSRIQEKIDQIKKGPKWNPPSEVHEYSYNGKRVFYFSSNCCDQCNTVYDNNGNYIGAPSGGIGGKGDGRCPDFNRNAKQVRLVWKDDR